jgi:hypothetical protein
MILRVNGRILIKSNRNIIKPPKIATISNKKLAGIVLESLPQPDINTEIIANKKQMV